MPNHFHGIIIVGAPLAGALLVDTNNTMEPTKRAPTRGAPTHLSLGDMIGAFKSITTCEYIKGIKNHNWTSFDKKFWQQNYYEHVIRNEKSLEKIREYIISNPYTWKQDKLFYQK